MSYAKPDVAPAGSALLAINGTQYILKDILTYIDWNDPYHWANAFTPCAYEADE